MQHLGARFRALVSEYPQIKIASLRVTVEPNTVVDVHVEFDYYDDLEI